MSNVYLMQTPPSNVTNLPIAEPPQFEGHQVSSARARLTGVTSLDIDQDYQIDEVVRVTVEGTVTAVAHNVDPVSGALVRVHTIKVHDATALSPLAWSHDDAR